MEDKKPEINVTPQVDLSAALTTESLDPKVASAGYDQAVDIVRNLSNNANQQIAQNHIDTIGTERGGQRSMLVGANDNYMMNRYSTPTVESLVNTFKVASANRALSTAYDNELRKLQKEAEAAVKARRQRDNARAAAAAAAASGGSGGSGGTATTLGALNAEGTTQNNTAAKALGKNQTGATFVSGDSKRILNWLAQNGKEATPASMGQAAKALKFNPDQLRHINYDLKHHGIINQNQIITMPIDAPGKNSITERIRRNQEATKRRIQSGRGR